MREATKRLQQAGMESAQREAEWLLGHLLQRKPAELYLFESPVPDGVADAFFAMIARRASGHPLQYVLGEADFFGERFAVAPGVFIPRPETEAVVEAALERFRALERRRGCSLRLLDAGTGSGCIAATLAKHLSTCAVVAVEVSWATLCMAAENLRRHGLSARVQVVCGRWLEPLRSGDFFDGIVSNPPYVPTRQVDALPLDVRQEPRVSLDGGMDGLDHARRLLDAAPRVLRPGGLVIMECGEDQAGALEREAAGRPWVAVVSELHDLAGRPRGVIIERTDA